MGFRLRREYVLEFTGAMQGAEVRIKATSVGACVALREAGADISAIAELLSEHLVSWNLESEDGEPLGMSASEIQAGLERVVIEAIAVEWFKAAMGITAPLDPPSTDGEPFPEESLPMEVL